MISAAEFLDALDGGGFHTLTGVPCSYFTHVYDLIGTDSRFRYVPAPHEGIAFSLAAGLELVGTRCAVLAQNSGFGNLVNPLTSLAMPYRIPVLTFLTMRGWPVASAQEPQHEVMGRTLPSLLHTLGLPMHSLPADPVAVKELLHQVCLNRAVGVPEFILIPEKIAASGLRPDHGNAVSLPDRRAVLTELVSACPDALFISTTGYISRDMFAMHDDPRHLYLQGSMGHASAVAAGVASGQSGRRVVVLDGDGSALMHLGTLSLIGAATELDLLHVVLDNGGYESTGGQPSTASTVDFPAVARACGYRRAVSVRDVAQLRAAATGPGPAMLHVPISLGVHPPGDRATAAISPDALARRFHLAVTGTELP